MSMFSNYLDTNYIPNNIKPEVSDIYLSNNIKPPYLIYDIKNRLIGMCWSEEDKFTLKVSLERNIYLDPDSIVYTTLGDTPKNYHATKKGLKAYNTEESKSWTCVEAGNSLVWSEDPTFQYPKSGLVPYKFKYDMREKELFLEVTNFKYDVIKSFSFNNTNVGNLEVGTEDFKLKEGIYYIKCYIIDVNEKILMDTKLVTIGNYDGYDFIESIRKQDISFAKIIYDGENVLSDETIQVIWDGGALS